jgi:hypothetical protein
MAVSTVPVAPERDHHRQPETVIRGHQRGFHAYWRWKSRYVGGRPRFIPSFER